jgi:hypothetical protein
MVLEEENGKCHKWPRRRHSHSYSVTQESIEGRLLRSGFLGGLTADDFRNDHRGGGQRHDHVGRIITIDIIRDDVSSL